MRANNRRNNAMQVRIEGSMRQLRTIMIGLTVRHFDFMQGSTIKGNAGNTNVAENSQAVYRLLQKNVYGTYFHSNGVCGIQAWN
jgi:hypothetical protein